MMDLDGMEEFGDQVSSLEDDMQKARDVASAFGGELQDMQGALADTGRQVSGVSSGLSRGLRGAFDGVVFDGLKLSDALRNVGQSMVNAAYGSAVNPVSKHLGQVVGGGMDALVQAAMPFANGASFSGGRVTPFARGGVVDGPVSFPMRGGTGLMGEAGPEAIMPLTRGADGKLGVRSEAGASPVQVVMNIQTPDAKSFQRSQGQIASQMGRALSRGQRNR